MKKVLFKSLLLSFVAVLSLAACSGNKEEAKHEAAPAQTAPTAAADETPEQAPATHAE